MKRMSRGRGRGRDLFDAAGKVGKDQSYTAKDIEVLEGLEPVRRRPGMYIGGTDERALHHLAAEVLDNAMDEAVSGHASRIEMTLGEDGTLTVSDNGRGIPVDPHPKFKPKSALEIILTTLHSGGKFSEKAYKTAGGLHGVGLSVVNALSEWLEVEVARDRKLYVQTYARGAPTSKLKDKGPVQNRRGTRVAFRPDPQIFKAHALRSAKALPHGALEGLSLPRRRDPLELPREPDRGQRYSAYGGFALSRRARGLSRREPRGHGNAWCRSLSRARVRNNDGETVEWALTLASSDGEPFLNSYCNTIPTPEGGTHEAGLRAALVKGLRAYGERARTRRPASSRRGRDGEPRRAALRLHARSGVPGPDQGAAVERGGRSAWSRPPSSDHFDHWLADAPEQAATASRLSRRARGGAPAPQAGEGRRAQDGDAQAAPARQARRLHASRGRGRRDLHRRRRFSAGGSAKQARDRATQAVLPLRGKILNVASATAGKLEQNQELNDLIQALGCGTGARYREADLRYEQGHHHDRRRC